MEIKTERLVIRPFMPEDLDDIYEYCSQPGIGENAGWPVHESLKQTSEILVGWIKAGYKQAIVLRENGKVIGHIAIDPDSEEGRTDTRELGCALNREYQRLGIMTEAIRATADCLFQNEIVYIWACCFQNNIPSKGMIEKCGFIFQQKGTYYSKGFDKTFPSLEYRLSKAEWKRRGSTDFNVL